MNKEWLEISSVYKELDYPVSDSPTPIDEGRAGYVYDWLCWTATDFLEAAIEEDVVETAKIIIDIMYFLLGILVEMGVQPDELLEIVHSADIKALRADSTGEDIEQDFWVDYHAKIKAIIERMHNP